MSDSTTPQNGSDRSDVPPIEPVLNNFDISAARDISLREETTSISLPSDTNGKATTIKDENHVSSEQMALLIKETLNPSQSPAERRKIKTRHIIQSVVLVLVFVVALLRFIYGHNWDGAGTFIGLLGGSFLFKWE